MKAQTAERRSGIGGGLKILLGFFLFILLCVVITSVIGRQMHNRWEAYAAKLRAQGEPITFEEIGAVQAPLPDNRNSARIIEPLRDQLTKIGNDASSSEYRRRIPFFNRNAPDLDFFNGTTKETLDAARQFIDKHADTLNALSKIESMPTGRLELPDSQQPLKSLVPAIAPVRAAARLEMLKHGVELADGNTEAAVHTSILIANLSGAMDQHPTLITRLIQIACDALFVRSIENTLRVGQPDAASIQHLQEAVNRRLENATAKWALWGERACFVAVCELAAAGKLNTAAVSSGTDSSVPWLPNILTRTNQIRGAEMLSGLIDVADKPVELMKRSRNLQTELEALSMTQVLTKILIPSLERSIYTHLRGVASLNCAMVTLAAEQYRMDNGHLPESIDQLIPKYLDAVPSDPFDGQHLRLIKTDQGITIYAIGEDQKDDGGSIISDSRISPPADYGVRLLNPQYRGLLILEEQAAQ